MKPVIAVDAMGGDHGPSVTVPAALDFLASHPQAELLLVGLADALEREVARHPRNARLTVVPATEVVGMANLDLEVEPSMAGEDFAYMLKSRPGAFIFIGNGDSAPLHNPTYDFSDDAIAYGISYWVRLAEQRLGG